MALPTEPRSRAFAISTAHWIAAARALETARPDRLFEDPWAELLSGEGGRAALAAADYNPFLPVRTRFFDDQIVAATGEGSQVVLLSAGLDTRAFRLPLAASCTVFEIDYPEALAQKEALLHSVPPVCRRRSVPADLSANWRPALLQSGFDRRAPTVWIAEGLFFYLTAPVVEALIQDAADLSSDASVFLADLFGTGLLELESMAPLVSARTSARLPLPFCTDIPAALFSANGWANPQVVLPGQPAANYGRLSRGSESGAAEQPSSLRTYLVTAALR